MPDEKTPEIESKAAPTTILTFAHTVIEQAGGPLAFTLANLSACQETKENYSRLHLIWESYDPSGGEIYHKIAQAIESEDKALEQAQLPSISPQLRFFLFALCCESAKIQNLTTLPDSECDYKQLIRRLIIDKGGAIQFTLNTILPLIKEHPLNTETFNLLNTAIWGSYDDSNGVIYQQITQVIESEDKALEQAQLPSISPQLHFFLFAFCFVLYQENHEHKKITEICQTVVEFWIRYEQFSNLPHGTVVIKTFEQLDINSFQQFLSHLHNANQYQYISQQYPSIQPPIYKLFPLSTHLLQYNAPEIQKFQARWYAFWSIKTMDHVSYEFLSGSVDEKCEQTDIPLVSSIDVSSLTLIARSLMSLKLPTEDQLLFTKRLIITWLKKFEMLLHEKHTSSYQILSYLDMGVDRSSKLARRLHLLTALHYFPFIDVGGLFEILQAISHKNELGSFLKNKILDLISGALEKLPIPENSKQSCNFSSNILEELRSSLINFINEIRNLLLEIKQLSEATYFNPYLLSLVTQVHQGNIKRLTGALKLIWRTHESFKYNIQENQYHQLTLSDIYFLSFLRSKGLAHASQEGLSLAKFERRKLKYAINSNKNFGTSIYLHLSLTQKLIDTTGEALRKEFIQLFFERLSKKPTIVVTFVKSLLILLALSGVIFWVTTIFLPTYLFEKLNNLVLNPLRRLLAGKAPHWKRFFEAFFTFAAIAGAIFATLSFPSIVIPVGVFALIASIASIGVLLIKDSKILDMHTLINNSQNTGLTLHEMSIQEAFNKKCAFCGIGVFGASVIAGFSFLIPGAQLITIPIAFVLALSSLIKVFILPKLISYNYSRNQNTHSEQPADAPYFEVVPARSGFFSKPPKLALPPLQKPVSANTHRPRSLSSP
jgi:hypothetical protein